MSVPFDVRPGSLPRANDNDLSDDDVAGTGGASGVSGVTGGFDFAKREAELRRLDEELNAQKSKIVQKTESLVKAQAERFRLAGAADAFAADAGSAAAAGGSGDAGAGLDDFEIDPVVASAAGASAAAAAPATSGARAQSKTAAAAAAAKRPAADRKSVGGAAAAKPKAAAPAAARGSRPGSAALGAAAGAGAGASAGAASASSAGAGTGAGAGGGAGGARFIGGEVAAAVSSEADEELSALGVEARMQFYRTRVNTLQTGLETLAADARDKEQKLGLQQQTIHKLLEDRKKLQKACQGYEVEIERQKKIAADANTRAATLEREIANVRKEAASADAARKALEAGNRERDVKLSRALHDADKFRNALRDAKEQAAAKGKSDGETARLRAEVKKLQQQKAELLNGFKKQMKLIDILRRQKLHVEAAKLLSFSEDEFAKTLELGGELSA